MTARTAPDDTSLINSTKQKTSQLTILAGMYAVGAVWGFREVNELLENGGKAIINRPMELMKLIQSK